MARCFLWIRGRLDRVGVLLSALVPAALRGRAGAGGGAWAGGGLLLDPAIHKVGLVLATLIAAVAIGVGALRHRRAAPFVVAMTGLSLHGRRAGGRPRV